MIVANPFTTIIPKIPVHLPPIDPAAEDGPLWSALSAAMPQLKQQQAAEITTMQALLASL